ncbi:Ger(x)C family spore germination protein [Paenibacillus humicola]|uniref:Ger(x)C family spore germination protein n=1 Tax=Paenibacillus humicola TaxID=3110540 RepID=UPI00237C3ECD|nr:Ger(x)C family spore germination protein [Paenibacillus humicola]
MARPFLCMILIAALVLTTGCWDRTEVNDLAIVMGTALDVTKKGEVKGTVQIALPQQAGTSDGSGRKEKFFVLSAAGQNNMEAIQRLQNKLSRRLFTSHRSVIFISERLARRGLGDILDIFTHDPHNRLRTFIMVVRGGDPEKIVEVQYPFEEAPTEAVKEMEILGDHLSVTLRDFFIASSSEGGNPVAAAITPEISSGKSKKDLFRFSGAAVFKELKLAGFLNEKETDGLLWITGRKKQGRIVAALPKGYGSIGMVLVTASSKITSEVNGDKVKFHIRLRGNGDLLENNSPLDITRMPNLKMAEKALEDTVAKQAKECLYKIQKEYKSDVAGFGGVLFRNHPRKWKQIQKKWDKLFPEAEISVSVKLNLRETGVSGPPLQLKEKEIVK